MILNVEVRESMIEKGFFATIQDFTGNIVHWTKIYPTVQDAKKAAYGWINGTGN
jgi:hypothetical protein